MGRGRAPCCDKSKVKKGPWSPAEDLRLISFIQKHGHGNWRALPKQAGLLRCGKSCRLRWINYLRPDVKRGNFTPEEEDAIINLHNSLGNKWSKIASHFPGRTDNEIKNVWNTNLKKRLIHKNDKTKKSSTEFSSDSTVSREDQNMENILYGDDQENQDQNLMDEQSSSSSSSSCSVSSVSSCSEPKMLSPTEVNAATNQDISIEEVGEIPFEPDIEFWSMLDTLDELVAPQNSQEYNDNSNSYDVDNDNNLVQDDHYQTWLKHLENELGLAGTVTDEDQQSHHHNVAETMSDGDDLMLKPADNCLDTAYFPRWPPSPLNFGI